MKKKTRYTLQRTMIIYFLLIGFASLLLGVEFVMDTNSPELKAGLLSNFEKFEKNQISEDTLFAPIVKLRNKAVLMIGIIMIVIVIVLTMFIKNITEPLQHMLEMSREISAGDLSRTVEIDATNELADMGNLINDMSSNLQEIIWLSRNMCNYGDDFVEKILAVLDKPDPGEDDIKIVAREVKDLKAELETLGQVIEYFNFYTVEGKSGSDE
ncbi:HAMP domain-containing protein [Desulfobacterales bacterium HSG16]|nr:HAMP domain-containing protein [Desulfobacterales bacterium HSG16]